METARRYDAIEKKQGLAEMKSKILEMRLDLVDKRITIEQTKIESLDKKLNADNLSRDHKDRKFKLGLELKSLLQPISSDLKTTT